MARPIPRLAPVMNATFPLQLATAGFLPEIGCDQTDLGAIQCAPRRQSMDPLSAGYCFS
jgi:hypothetical protein